jgi:hypothetical protein
MKIYLNQMTPQIEQLGAPVMFLRGEPPPGSNAPVGCWRCVEKDYIDPEDPNGVWPGPGLVGYLLPYGIYIMASWVTNRDIEEDSRLVYWRVVRSKMKIIVSRFDCSPKNVLDALQLVTQGSPHVKGCFEVSL